MTRLALADSPLARTLLKEGAALPTHLETGGPLLASALGSFPNTSWLVHNVFWDWSLAQESLSEVDLAETRRVLERTRAPWLSVHLAFSAADVFFDSGMQAATPTLKRDDLLERLIRNTRVLKEAIRVPLLLENLDYNPTGAYEHICEPDVIAEVLEVTDTFLLLDLAHAQVSASRLGIARDAYIQALPLERVRQLHISSPRERNGVLYDAHEPLLERDLSLLKAVLGRTEPLALTLEYTRERNALLEQLAALSEVLEGAAELA